MHERFIYIPIIIFVVLAPNAKSMSLLDKLNFIAGQSQYVNQVNNPLQIPFSLDNVMIESMEIAMESCQSSFKGDRWNCPSSDFLRRRSSKSPLMDREDVYVNAITTAAMLYTITKNCAIGIIAECGSCSNNPYTTQCSDNPKEAEKLFHEHSNLDFSNDFYGKLSSHNYKAITNLLEKSLTRQCFCVVMGPGGVCTKDLCLETLKPFSEISNDIRQMYEEGLELNNTPENSRILWENIPLDALAYTKDSPNYCEPDAVPFWHGMHGRQCSMAPDGEELSEEERSRCNHLCHECGYRVRTQKVLTESSCNCKLTWGFQVQCEMCVIIQNQYICY